MNTTSARNNVFSIFARFSHPALKYSVIIVFLTFIGCAATSNYKSNPAPPNLPENARVLLIPIDVQLFELTAGGLQEPKADWTAAAEKNVCLAPASMRISTIFALSVFLIA